MRDNVMLTTLSSEMLVTTSLCHDIFGAVKPQIIVMINDWGQENCFVPNETGVDFSIKMQMIGKSYVQNNDIAFR